MSSFDAQVARPDVGKHDADQSSLLHYLLLVCFAGGPDPADQTFPNKS